MSFNAQDLSVLAYANGFTHWHYRTRDSLEQIMSGYFAGAAELLRAGDQITITLLGPDRADLASFAVTGLPVSGAPRLALLANSCSRPPAAMAA
ncbi:hypothetical protein [Dongia sp.]|uniref:hypothetical protein n=1 Tax=Dongia sp. TaxID=1977262 RepID=UPI0035B3296D